MPAVCGWSWGPLAHPHPVPCVLPLHHCGSCHHQHASHVTWDSGFVCRCPSPLFLSQALFPDTLLLASEPPGGARLPAGALRETAHVRLVGPVALNSQSNTKIRGFAVIVLLFQVDRQIQQEISSFPKHELFLLLPTPSCRPSGEPQSLYGHVAVRVLLERHAIHIFIWPGIHDVILFYCVNFFIMKKYRKYDTHIPLT